MRQQTWFLRITLEGKFQDTDWCKVIIVTDPKQKEAEIPPIDQDLADAHANFQMLERGKISFDYFMRALGEDGLMSEWKQSTSVFYYNHSD